MGPTLSFLTKTMSKMNYISYGSPYVQMHFQLGLFIFLLTKFKTVLYNLLISLRYSGVAFKACAVSTLLSKRNIILVEFAQRILTLIFITCLIGNEAALYASTHGGKLFLVVPLLLCFSFQTYQQKLDEF